MSVILEGGHGGAEEEQRWRCVIALTDLGSFCQYILESKNGFFALLGCPNGGGIVRILIDHCTALDYKTITSVRVLSSSSPMLPPIIYFVLADCSVVTPPKKLKSRTLGRKEMQSVTRKPTVAKRRALCLLVMLSGGVGPHEDSFNEPYSFFDWPDSRS